MVSPEKINSIIFCPTCGSKTLYHQSNTFRPFCSERCRTTDLGAWASEEYRIPGGPSETKTDEKKFQIEDYQY